MSGRWWYDYIWTGLPGVNLDIGKSITSKHFDKSPLSVIDIAIHHSVRSLLKIWFSFHKTQEKFLSIHLKIHDSY